MTKRVFAEILVAVALTRDEFRAEGRFVRKGQSLLRPLLPNADDLSPKQVWDALLERADELGVGLFRIDADPDGINGPPTSPEYGLGFRVAGRSAFVQCMSRAWRADLVWLLKDNELTTRLAHYAVLRREKGAKR